MTGFGRTGRRWGHEHFPIRPDIVYGGKGLGGGYVPIGMVAATDDVVEPLRGQRVHVLHVHRQRRRLRRRRRPCSRSSRPSTSSSEPAAMGDVLGGLLDDALGDHPHVVDLRGRGLFRGIELARDAGRRSPGRAHFAAGRPGVPRPRHVDLPGRLGPGRRTP